jgi:hypothetical protein
MSELNLSIAGLFQRAFGRGRGYDASEIAERTAVDIEYDYPDADTQEGTEFLTVRNQLNSKLYDGRSIFMPVRLGGILLPNEPTLRLRRSKRIERTTLTGSGRPGSVKELIYLDDWEIVIRGIAVNSQSTQFYPEDQVSQLRDLEARQEALDIECALTSLFGIYRVVITDADFPEMIGIQHAQAYEFRCYSDEDFILTID